MQNVIREHAKFVWGLVGGLATILGFLFAVLPNFRALLESGWLYGWAATVCLMIACILVWHTQDRSLQHSEADIASRDESLREDSANISALQSTIAAHENTLASERAEKAVVEADLASARAQIRSLQRPIVTDRDKELFGRLCNGWPPNRGTLYWLKSSFNGRSWSSETSRQVVEFADIEQETRFDDSLVNTSFARFRESCDELSLWLTGNSFPSEVNPSKQVVPVRGSSEEDFHAFEVTREEGMKLADAVIASWRTLERTGRARGL
ncbi:hypothetical protein [Brachybacterium vulturis]|uniref:hypothetical protein n=1 Tax=Brachybacterium vulturis TaxID=2017484 RepID=UPI0037357EBE